jgi:hypothetical protein
MPIARTFVASLAAALVRATARRRRCRDGIRVGDEVYSTRHDEHDVFWLIGTVMSLESTDLMRVDWHTHATHPLDGERYPMSPGTHEQWLDRAGVAHTICLPETGLALSGEHERRRRR